MKNTILLFLVLITVSGCTITQGIPSPKEDLNYPKISADADKLITLLSNKQRTTFYIDGNEVAIGRRVKAYITNREHVIIASPEGYKSKEEFIQPPYYDPFELSFTFLLEDQLTADAAPARPTSQAPQKIELKPDTAPALASGSIAKRTALVIGNSSYRNAPLKNPTNDARSVANTLSQLGFNVELLVDADLKVLEKSVKEFGKRLHGGGVGLFYFAGHGIQVKGVNYLVPVDATIESEAEVPYETMDTGRVLSWMEEAGNELNIVILDACRNNPFSRSFRSASRGLAVMDAPKGSIIAYSTAPGSVAADGDGQNSIYTKHLLDHMQTYDITIEEVLKRVRIDVMKDTADKQTPWESSSLRGYFSFAPKR